MIFSQYPPANPLLAEPLYQAGYIERLGTGTLDIIRIAKDLNLPEPQFIQEDSFKFIAFRPTAGQVTGQATGQELERIMELLNYIKGDRLTNKGDVLENED